MTQCRRFFQTTFQPCFDLASWGIFWGVLMSKDSILCPIRWFFAADENRGHTHAENNCLPIFFRIETTFRQRRTTKMTQRWQKPTFPQNQGKVQHFYDYLRPGWPSAGWTLVDHQVTLGVSLCFASCLCALFKGFLLFLLFLDFLAAANLTNIEIGWFGWYKLKDIKWKLGQNVHVFRS